MNILVYYCEDRCDFNKEFASKAFDSASTGNAWAREQCAEYMRKAIEKDPTAEGWTDPQYRTETLELVETRNEHCGYTNKETFLVMLNYEETMRLTSYLNTPSEYQEYIEGCLEDDSNTPKPGFWQDMLNCSLSLVDWRQVSSLVNEARKEEDKQCNS